MHDQLLRPVGIKVSLLGSSQQTRWLDYFSVVTRMGERDESVGLAVQDEERGSYGAGIEGLVLALHHQVLRVAAEAEPERLAD